MDKYRNGLDILRWQATSTATGATNGLVHQLNLGNLSNWTFTANFQFDTAGARFAMMTHNIIQNTNGCFFEVNSGTGNLVIYYTTGQNGYTASGGLTAESTNATGITFTTGVTYTMTLIKNFRTMTFRISNGVTT